MRSGFNVCGTSSEPDPGKDDITYNGLTGGYTVAPDSSIVSPAPLTELQALLDGPEFADPGGIADSEDDSALLRFDNVFGDSPGQAPVHHPVAKAWLVLTTSNDNVSASTRGRYSVHSMLHPWTVASLHSGFGAVPSLQVSDGEIGSPIDVQEGMIVGSEVWFDVTEYYEGVRNGSQDLGLAVISDSTAHGWKIHLNGSDPLLRPRLLIASAIPEPTTLAQHTWLLLSITIFHRERWVTKYRLTGDL